MILRGGLVPPPHDEELVTGFVTVFLIRRVGDSRDDLVIAFTLKTSVRVN